MHEKKKWKQTRKAQDIKGKYSCPIRSQLERKKGGPAELAQKLDANVRVTNFCALFAAYRARVQGLLTLWLAGQLRLVLITRIVAVTYIVVLATVSKRLEGNMFRHNTSAISRS